MFGRAALARFQSLLFFRWQPCANYKQERVFVFFSHRAGLSLLTATIVPSSCSALPKASAGGANSFSFEGSNRISIPGIAASYTGLRIREQKAGHLAHKPIGPVPEMHVLIPKAQRHRQHPGIRRRDIFGR